VVLPAVEPRIAQGCAVVPAGQEREPASVASLSRSIPDQLLYFFSSKYMHKPKGYESEQGKKKEK
jgi:hypothetical protein